MSWFYIQGILILTGINLLAVFGLSLVTGFTGLFSFGHAGFMAIGAYTSVMLTMKFGCPFIIAILIGGLVALLFSLVIGKLTLGLKGDYFCIVTLGFGEAIRLILDNISYFGGARGIPSIPPYTTLLNVVIINIIACIILVFVIKSKYGRNMVAIREEELAALVIGVDVFKTKMIALAISALYAGIAGGLWAHYLGFINPIMFKLVKSTELTIIVIFGGLGSISGSVVGTVLLTFLPEVLRSFSKWRLVVYGLAVIIVMITRPKGIMGGKEFNFKFITNKFKKKRGDAINE